MIEGKKIICDECRDFLGEADVSETAEGCAYSLCLDCGLLQMQQKRNKLNREISTLKKASLKD